MAQHFHPRERARAEALARYEAIDRERLEAQAKRLPFNRWDELQAAHDAIRTAHVGVANVVPCERCGVDVDLDDPDTLVIHVTAAVRRLRGGVGFDLKRYQVPPREDYPVTPYGVVVALRPPKEKEMARCKACGDHTLAYLGESPSEAAPDPVTPKGRG